MDIFKSGTLTWWQVGIFKLALLLIGVAIGATLHAFFIPYAPQLFTAGVLLSFYIAYVWFR